MNATRLLAFLPLAAWGGAALSAARGPAPVPARAERGLLPGFGASYDAATGAWTWQYAKEMPDGCIRLIMPDSNAVRVDEGSHVISVTLKTYREEGVCGLPARTVAFRGHINYYADATFSLTLDGKAQD